MLNSSRTNTSEWHNFVSKSAMYALMMVPEAPFGGKRKSNQIIWKRHDLDFCFRPKIYRKSSLFKKRNISDESGTNV